MPSFWQQVELVGLHRYINSALLLINMVNLYQLSLNNSLVLVADNDAQCLINFVVARSCFPFLTLASKTPSEQNHLFDFVKYPCGGFMYYHTHHMYATSLCTGLQRISLFP